MKKALPLPLMTVALAAGGRALRGAQLASGFEESGFAVPGHPLNLWMLVFVLVTLAVTGITAKGTVGKFDGYHAAFHYHDPLWRIPYCVAGALLVPEAGKVLGAVLRGEKKSPGEIIWSVVGVVMAIALISTWGINERKAPGRWDVCLLIPGYAACVWLIRVYQANTAKPELWAYLPLLLGVVCAVLAFCFMAGFRYGRPRPVLFGWCASAAAVLLITATADGEGALGSLMELGVSLYLLTQLVLMCWHGEHPADLTPDPEEKTGEAEGPAAPPEPPAGEPSAEQKTEITEESEEKEHDAQ